MSDRLPAGLEASALVRQAEASGGSAYVLRKGDPDRGSLILLVAQKGTQLAVLERRLAPDFTYVWASIDTTNRDIPSILADRARIDPDSWLIELDIPQAERFIAETIAQA